MRGKRQARIENFIERMRRYGPAHADEVKAQRRRIVSNSANPSRNME